LVAAPALAIDAWISLGLTCQQIGNQSAADYYAIKNCGIFDGPLLAGLVWFADFFDSHGEAVTAAFTVVLSISTGLLWWSTNKLWNVTRVAADHIPRVERAYVHGGPGVAGMVKSAAVPTLLVTITVNNYGKTPAFVNYVCWDVYAIGATPTAPDFTKNRKFVDMFIKADVVYETSVTLTFTAPSLLYILIEYEDMFGNAHETGLAYRIFPRQHGYNEPVEGAGAYRKWT
jgi:hypothetical protein